MQTIEKSAELREALSRIALTQAEFWDAMSAFEKLAEVEIDSTNQDFTVYADPTDDDVEEFIERFAEEVGPVTDEERSYGPRR